jgi:RNA-directed DNA polymerase
MGWRRGSEYRRSRVPRYGSLEEAGDPHLRGDWRNDQMTGRDQTLLDQEMVVAKLNRTMIGWANYFCLGPVSAAYQAVDQHARNRLLQWLCAKLVWPAAKRFPETSLHEVLGLVCLTKRTSDFPWTTP